MFFSRRCERHGMNIPTIREFRLSPPGSDRGISCDANGAFIGAAPLLKRSSTSGRDEWQPRDRDQLSKQVSASYGVPIDMTSKMGGLNAISRALNDGDIARAQIATVLLAIPDPPTLAKNKPSRSELIKFIRDLHWSGMVKADWDSDEHPRWPAGSPDSQGGQFAPKGNGAPTQIVSSAPAPWDQRTDDKSLLLPAAANARDVPGRRSEKNAMNNTRADQAICDTLPTNRDKANCRASAS